MKLIILVASVLDGISGVRKEMNLKFRKSLNSKAACGCKVMTETIEECQKICDDTSYCEAWTFEQPNKFCWTKKREGWVSHEAANYFSGLKNGGPWYEKNINYAGGDYICPN